MRELYDLAYVIGKYNKPVIANFNGACYNSAASMMCYFPFATASVNAKWMLNEVNIGYFPDAGASYLLSRLEGELGTYLALTG